MEITRAVRQRNQILGLIVSRATLFSPACAPIPILRKPIK
jgi:hypothetical protein